MSRNRFMINKSVRCRGAEYLIKNVFLVSRTVEMC